MTRRFLLALAMAFMFLSDSAPPQTLDRDHDGEPERLAVIHNVGHRAYRVRFRDRDDYTEHVFTVDAGQKLLTQRGWEGGTLISIDRGRRGRLRDVASLQHTPEIPGQIWVLEVRGGW